MIFEEKYNEWLASDALSEAEKSELLALSEKEIEDRFYRDLDRDLLMGFFGKDIAPS